ncbi:DUF1877 family protein [Lignipirellula cremea]|uniref:DUF1877 domain-containing protein n=1 Tax=Lignipirellula cremea TaxID=2528010 RepID=A0A518DZR5_9BACT|nr:DUF1877 family protein [Lignipirellula cremea]QDU97332.1 hypothetical protein Pla8534_51780 [Lignipirellula cremea]
MGVTNGFLKLPRDEFDKLCEDQAALAARAQEWDESRGYLDMDKAGYELLFMFDPSLVEAFAAEGPAPYPHITTVLGGGEVVLPDLDLGYGPAHRIPEETLRNSIPEFKAIQFEEAFALAKNESIAELLPRDADEEEFRGYHWAYLQSLGDFVQQAVDDHSVVLRY